MDEVIDFKYDTMNRLIETTEGSDITYYYYDNAGNRFIKIGTDATTVYLRHGQIAVAMDIEINEDQGVDKGKKNRYVLSGDLVAGRITTIVHYDDSTTVTESYYHLDHLNSSKCVTDTNGVIEVNYTYRAFGEQLKRLDSNGQDTDDKAKYSYGGKELDDGTNLYYFNARYYDATIGRFINVDPVQDGGNWYVYCGNNPMCFIDPTGLNQVPPDLPLPNDESNGEATFSQYDPPIDDNTATDNAATDEVTPAPVTDEELQDQLKKEHEELEALKEIKTMYDISIQAHKELEFIPLWGILEKVERHIEEWVVKTFVNPNIDKKQKNIKKIESELGIRHESEQDQIIRELRERIEKLENNQ